VPCHFTTPAILMFSLSTMSMSSGWTIKHFNQVLYDLTGCLVEPIGIEPMTS
jgi:hypothetical protein